MRAAQTRLQQSGTGAQKERLTLLQLDMNDLARKFAKGSVDVVVAYSVLEEVPNLAALLAQVCHCCRRISMKQKHCVRTRCHRVSHREHSVPLEEKST